jgi:uncharacterized protein
MDRDVTRMGPVDGRRSPGMLLRPLPLDAVRIEGGLWAERRRVNATTSLRRGYEMLERAGNISLLRAAANGEHRALDPVSFPPFIDTDVHKWLEAVAWAAADGLPRSVARAADELTSLVLAAQEPDGYLNTFYQVGHPGKRWTDLAYGHELYSAGHLIQAGVAWSRTTGDRRLLDAAIRFADHIDSVFGPGRRQEPDGHAEVETALVELFRETGERRYLDLARFFLGQRGKGLLGGNVGRWYFGGRAYFQDRVPVREARTLEGHAVRALYLAAGAADVAIEDPDRGLLGTSLAQWSDLVDGKLFITGGVGQRTETEGFGDPYELPPDRGYCETCAAVASVQWSWRLLLATGDPRHAELIERTLYNAILPSVSVDGRSFFYGNPLMSRAGHRRSSWYHVACCPPNVMRLLASLQHYVATGGPDGVQVHQYVAGSIVHAVDDGSVRLSIETAQPWEGDVRVRVEEAPGSAWVLQLRIPAWADGARVRVGSGRERVARPGEVVRLRRRWRAGDSVGLELPMAPRFVEAHPRVEAVRGQVVLERGPLVYCWEAADQAAGVDVVEAAVDVGAPIEPEWRTATLGGALCLRVQGSAAEARDDGPLYRRARVRVGASGRPVELVALPYYLWANRGKGAMRVWIPRKDDRG